MSERRDKASMWILLFILIIFLTIFMTGCVSNTVLLETRVNDPIMMNLLDNDADISQVEDGIGFIGEAATCPT